MRYHQLLEDIPENVTNLREGVNIRRKIREPTVEAPYIDGNKQPCVQIQQTTCFELTKALPDGKCMWFVPRQITPTVRPQTWL